MKEMLSQAFGSPKGHPKVKPFVDHVFSFFFVNGKIFFRNYQISYDANQGTQKDGEPVLVEIGPRFTLVPIKILAGSFSGAVMWQNPQYVSPNTARAAVKRQNSMRYVDRTNAKKARTEYEEENKQEDDVFADLFA
jgi:ribosome biogenesis protein BRX1